ncbi:MAG: hypothetical protein A2341_14605 [Deltaproteobacteria bacterium RIFOXYB12_FULL_58_9]|nr:MAG: hypothetical protein A2341_14605 [Deltaproteobacteria bacterium RIFOXYB12_FULL_58_9]
MPAFPHLLTDDYSVDDITAKLEAFRTLGVPYGDNDVAGAEASMKTQAEQIAVEIALQRGPKDLASKEVAALIAYLQRLGTDIQWRPVRRPASLATVAPAKEAAQAGDEASKKEDAPTGAANPAGGE